MDNKCLKCGGRHRKDACPFRIIINGLCQNCYLPRIFDGIQLHEEGEFGREQCKLQTLFYIVSTKMRDTSFAQKYYSTPLNE